MELEEAVEKLNYKKTIRDLKDYVKDNNCMLADAIKVVLNHLAKQEKMIELMTDKFYRHGFFCIEPVKSYDVESELEIKSKTKEDIKQYFEKKAEESE